MASASGIRMGKVFVEIGADPAKFFAAIQGIQKSIGRIGSAMSSLGTRMAGVGAAFGAPFVGAVMAGSKFEDVLLNIKASTGATAGQLEQVKAAAMSMSAALGVGPTEAAQGFMELLKAGMSVEQVLGGAGTAALQFAKVGEMAVADAAVVMADAMNVFKVSGDVAANTLSSAADASSTSIQGISLAFSQVSAVAALANQSIQDTGAALAVLANAGIKGSDAGTSLKTMLMRLMAPADDAAEALASIGLSTDAFRNADGTMKPMVEIIRTLTDSMGDMDQAARDDLLRRIFGADAIRAAAVFMQVGVDGFSAMQDGMNEALPVGEKFDALMGGLSGAVKNIYAAMERLAIAVTDAVGPSLVALAQPIADVIGGLASFISKNQELVLSIAKGVAIFIGVAAAITGIGAALSLVAGAMGLVLSPVGAVLAAVGGISFALVQAGGGFSEFADLANTTFSGIYAAIAEGDLAGAMDVLWAGLHAGWLKGIEGIVVAWHQAVGEIAKAFIVIGSAWDKYVTKPAQMFGVRVAEAVQEREVLGAFDITQGTIWDNESKKAARARRKVAEDLLSSGSAETFAANRAAAENTITDLQSVVDKAAAAGSTDQERKAGEAAAKEIEAYRNAIALVKARFAQLGIKTEEERAAELEKAQAEIDATTAASVKATQAGTADAAASVESKARGKRENRAKNQQFADLLKRIEAASSTSQLTDLYGEYDALQQTGYLNATQLQALDDALVTAHERILKVEGAYGTGSNVSQKIGDGARAAGGDAAQSQSEVAGTFSSMALGGMGFGSSIAQRQLDEQKKTNRILEDKLGDEGAVAA